jgi:hypothetical protein
VSIRRGGGGALGTERADIRVIVTVFNQKLSDGQP